MVRQACIRWCDRATEGLADFRQAVRSEFTGKPHGDLARAGDGTGTFLGIHVGDLDLVEVGDGFLYQFERDLAIGGADDVAQGFLGDVEVDFAPWKRA
jgi:hypothetical protein